MRPPARDALSDEMVSKKDVLLSYAWQRRGVVVSVLYSNKDKRTAAAQHNKTHTFFTGAAPALLSLSTSALASATAPAGASPDSFAISAALSNLPNDAWKSNSPCRDE